MNESYPSIPPVSFRSTSTLVSSGSHFASPVSAVGTDAPAYVGTIVGPQRVPPGTGNLNPYGYDEHSGTGFPAPVGNGLLFLFTLAFIYLCIKKTPKLYRRL